jgi:protein ImuB
VPDGLAQDKLAKFFGPLPLAALRIEEAMIAQLAQAGLRRINDLLMRPRAPLTARFGPNLHARLDEVLGRARAPFSPMFEAPAFVAERRFAEGITKRDDIESTIAALAADLCGLLARHGEGARRLCVTFFRIDGAVKYLEAGTSRPLRDPNSMARLFHERLETIGEDGLDTGYGFEAIRLAALQAERFDATQPSWDQNENQDGFDDLIDRLGARFGLARITRRLPVDSHWPEQAACAVPVANAPIANTICPAAKNQDDKNQDDQAETPSLPVRPVRLLRRPEAIDTIATIPDGPPLQFRWRRVLHHVAAIEGPERIAPEWWTREKSSVRDYFRAEDTAGQRFWLYREGLYRDTPHPRWFMHGLFA